MDWLRGAMEDIAMIAIVIVFFLVSCAYSVGCDRI